LVLILETPDFEEIFLKKKEIEKRERKKNLKN